MLNPQLIKNDLNESGLRAATDIPSGTILSKLGVTPVKHLCEVVSSAKFAGVSVEKNWQYVDISGENIAEIKDSSRLEFVDNGVETYITALRTLTAYQKCTANTGLKFDNGHVMLVAKQSITQNEELTLSYGTAFWLQEATKSNTPSVKIVAKIFLDTHQNFKYDLTKWRSWTALDCDEYLTYLDIDVVEFCKNLIVEGYSSRVALYRVFQAVGFVRPDPLSVYEHYPEALRTVAHESKELCFWPVSIGSDSDPKEKMRKKTNDGLEFGPNASWMPFPKTKLLYTAAKTDNLEMAREAGSEGNINAYGTCKHWSPLHVAAFYGSKEVVDFLLSKGAIYNSRDTSGNLPLDLAEAQAHVSVARSLLAQYTKDSLLVSTSTRLRLMTSSEENPGLQDIIDLKNKGNESFEKNNFKSAFEYYSRALEACPRNHKERIILLSNRAQVLITAKAHNLALRDCKEALELDPCHEKTLQRMAHCYENVNKPRCLEVLDLMMFVTVPSKLVKERRQFLFLKSILNEPNSSETAEDLSPHETMTFEIKGKEYKLDKLPMAELLELSLEALRSLDKKVGHFDQNY